ncbi:uncharacterized protein P884DRAFT_219312 [Thermothelomyces heterothallicus CBS 202.75]|uniref:uncharacterized protein n=1 Tax=Thermothelomyces heterothallicus CBS 202.75 TaxID=1149848 RepID=UPI0037447FBD
MLIQISLRAPNGQSRAQIDDDATLKELVELVKERTGLDNFSLKYGYPLKSLDISPSLQSTSIRELKLRGETIVVAPVDTTPPAPALQPASAEPKPKPFTPKGIEPDETSLEWPERGGYIVLRVMPDDNSCMFTAFGGAIGLENPSKTLRDQVADYILNHPNEYNKAILGEEPLVYTSRMRQMDTWGGAIELSILSDIYNIEISSIDVKSLRVDRFGENKPNRVIILYSGIHYDRVAFCMDLSYPVEVDVTRWSTDDEEVLDKARQLAQRLQSLHYYTDTTDFVIKCELCHWIGQGTREAAKHERETGHRQFGELQITD